MMERTFYHHPTLDNGDAPDSVGMDDDSGTREMVASEAEANLLSSLVKGEDPTDPLAKHMPVIDLDFPCELRDSTTPGHHHLLINHPIDWLDYSKLLDALASAGLVEGGYVHASESRGQTFIRTNRTRPPRPDSTHANVALDDLRTVMHLVRASVEGMDIPAGHPLGGALERLSLAAGMIEKEPAPA